MSKMSMQDRVVTEMILTMLNSGPMTARDLIDAVRIQCSQPCSPERILFLLGRCFGLKQVDVVGGYEPMRAVAAQTFRRVA